MLLVRALVNLVRLVTIVKRALGLSFHAQRAVIVQLERNMQTSTCVLTAHTVQLQDYKKPLTVPVVLRATIAVLVA